MEVVCDWISSGCLSGTAWSPASLWRRCNPCLAAPDRAMDEAAMA
jgi:hypothetical protein